MIRVGSEDKRRKQKEGEIKSRSNKHTHRKNETIYGMKQNKQTEQTNVKDRVKNRK
jgi:hypothetical protein